MKKSLKNHFFALSAGFLKEKMDFGKFAENWKNRPKIIFLDFLQDFWREKMDFGKFAEKWKNRSKIIFSDYLQEFWRENRLWWQLKRSPQNHFFRLSAGFLKRKVDIKQCSGKWIIWLKDRWVAIFFKDGKVKYIWKISNMLK